MKILSFLFLLVAVLISHYCSAQAPKYYQTHGGGAVIVYGDFNNGPTDQAWSLYGTTRFIVNSNYMSDPLYHKNVSGIEYVRITVFDGVMHTPPKMSQSPLTSATPPGNVPNLTADYYGRDYWIRKSDLEDKGRVEPVPNPVGFGTLTVPFKGYLKDGFKITAGGELGGFISYTIPSRVFLNRLSVLAHAGLTAVTDSRITISDSGGIKVKKDEQTKTVPAFTFGLGLVATVDDFQFGIIGGYDLPSAETSFPYARTPWISVTAGFTFLRFGKPSSKNLTN